MDFARAAIWFYGDSNYTIDHNTFLHNYQDIKTLRRLAIFRPTTY
jgi:hypothetical protein